MVLSRTRPIYFFILAKGSGLGMKPRGRESKVHFRRPELDTFSRTHVYNSPGPSYLAWLPKRTPTAPLFPMKAGPQPVHCVWTPRTWRDTPSSGAYTSGAKLTFTTFSTRESFGA